MLPPFRDVKTYGGGTIRLFPDGRAEVIVRDFGLTTEPECSPEAHAVEIEWFRAQASRLISGGP